MGSVKVDGGGSLPWSSLPVDMWFEVLSRLPRDKLVKFRCINKAFYSFITHLFIPRLAASATISGFIFSWQSVFVGPEFFEDWLIPREEELPGRHVRYSPCPGVEEEDFVTQYFHEYVEASSCHDGDGCFNREFITRYVSLLPFKMDANSETDSFLGCFSGIILVTSNISSSSSSTYYLCNPATKQCINIPVNPTHLTKKKKKPFLGLAFDPLDPPPHHFKIVRCTQPEEEEELRLDVFSSTTGKWVKHSIHLDDINADVILKSELVRHLVYLNGVLYMLSMAKYLLCFDLGESYYNSTNVKLKGHAIKLPHTSSSTRKDDYLGIFDSSNQCLYYACYVKYDLLVWTLQVNNKASPWLLKYEINISELYKLDKGGTLLSDTFIIYAVDLSRGIAYFGLYYYVWSYDIKTNQLNFVCILDAGSILENSFYHYSSCLVKLHDPFSIADNVLTEPLPLSLF